LRKLPKVQGAQWYILRVFPLFSTFS
jgi:hypothetical protein